MNDEIKIIDTEDFGSSPSTPVSPQGSAQQISEKKHKSSSILVITLAIIAFAGVGFGFYSWFFRAPEKEYIVSKNLTCTRDMILSEEEESLLEAYNSFADESSDTSSRFFELIQSSKNLTPEQFDKLVESASEYAIENAEK